MSFIYKVENIINNKIYIGKTIQSFEKRKRAHINLSKKSKTYFHLSLNKYGIENFKWEILTTAPKEELNQLEKDFIIKYKSNIKDFGYNLTEGADGCLGYKCTEEQIENRRKFSKIRWSKENSKKEASDKMKSITKNNPKYLESIKKAVKKSIINRKGSKLSKNTKQKMSDPTIYKITNGKEVFIGSIYNWATINNYQIKSSRNILYQGSYKGWKIDV